MSKNKNLHKAKTEKNDEFYTQLSDIENELQHYKEHFKDKIVYCNCDDHKWSNFFQYFSLNFEFLGLKKLITTHFSSDKIAYKLEISKDENGDGKINQFDTIETALKQNGDFRSDECIELLKESDIVVTNPPFSLFREFIDLMMQYDKKFLVIGNMNAITYKETFKLIKENKLWLGINNNQSFVFRTPYENELESNIKFCKQKGYQDKNYVKVPAINWFTNLNHKKRTEKLILYKTFNEQDYPKYDNYLSFEVSKVKDIPQSGGIEVILTKEDYQQLIKSGQEFELMEMINSKYKVKIKNPIYGVPITFLDKFNPEQFEILGLDDHRFNHLDKTAGCNSINGTKIYRRLIIKHKN